MTQKLATLWPEVTLLVGACFCLLTGLARPVTVRRAPAWIAGLTLIAAGTFVVSPSLASVTHNPLEAVMEFNLGLVGYVKLAIVAVGLILLLLAAQLPDRLPQTVDGEARTGGFEPADALRGEFFSLFLFSLAGAMLCAGADDLVWLFLSLELTSLPTYVMIAVYRDRVRAQESAVKYFFLGAMAAAVFIYGFALIYGATGSTQYHQIAAYVGHQTATAGAVSPLFAAGLVLAIIGVSFKTAAVPMHFYTPDVYQGAASPVAAFLAFVPKTAGFVSLVGLLALAQPLGPGQQQSLTWLLGVMAVLSMTVGNVMGLLQNNVKRVLAYSSVAHTGYLLVGLLVAHTAATNPHATGDHALDSGLAAVLFYLVAYGLATLGAFGVLGSVSRNGQEVETFDDLAGLGRRHPAMGAVMLVCVLSLIGLPPMVGFLGKIYLFGSAIQHGYLGLVIVAVLNSAVSAVYYLRIAAACYFSPPDDLTTALPVPARRIGAALAAIAAVILGIAGNRLVGAAHHAAQSVSHATPAWDADWKDLPVTW